MKTFIKSNLVKIGKGLSVGDLRALAQHEPENFVHKVQQGAEDGHLKLENLKDLRSLYQGLADVEVQVTAEVNGVQRTITSQAFPILTGTATIAQINDSYQAVETIGGELVTDFDDPKKVTTIAQISTLDKEVDEVAEREDFPEVGAEEEKVEIRHKKNGRKITFSVESILENELQDIVSRTNALGEIAAEWIEEQTLARVTDDTGSASSDAEPYVYRPAGTGTTLYSATANTPGTRAPLGNRITTNPFVDETDLENCRVRMATMLNNRGKRITIPRSMIKILVPDAIVGAVMKVLNSEYVSGVENEKSNWGPGGKWGIPAERVVSSPKLDDLSGSAWYYGAFQKQFKRKWKMRFEYVTLGSNTQAYLNSQIAFQARLAWDVEIGAVDYIYVLQCLSASTAPNDAR